MTSDETNITSNDIKPLLSYLKPSTGQQITGRGVAQPVDNILPFPKDPHGTAPPED